MSDYSSLSNEELKKRISASEEFMRSRMSAEEYATFIKELDSQKIEFKLEDKAFSKKKKRFSFSFDDLEITLASAPTFVVVLCKILNPILTLASFVFLIAGSLFSLFCAYSLYKTCTVSGWHGILETRYALYIILFFVINFIIGKLRLIVHMVANQ